MKMQQLGVFLDGYFYDADDRAFKRENSHQPALR